MNDTWTVIRHPGRGGDERWHTLCVCTGGDPAEDAARKVFEVTAGSLKTGVVVLSRNGTIIDHAGPPWLRTFIEIVVSQKIDEGQHKTKERMDARALPLS